MCIKSPCLNSDIYADGMCQFHYKLSGNKPEKKAKQLPIARESKKRAKENRLDQKQNKELLKARPMCEIKSPVCTGRSQGAHHPEGRIGKRLTDKDKKMSSCNACNDWIESHPLEAEKMKVKLSRNKIS